jgi:hypothetical protein
MATVTFHAAPIADELGWPRPRLPLTGEAFPW